MSIFEGCCDQHALRLDRHQSSVVRGYDDAYVMIMSVSRGLTSDRPPAKTGGYDLSGCESENPDAIAGRSVHPGHAAPHGLGPASPPDYRARDTVGAARCA